MGAKKKQTLVGCGLRRGEAAASSQGQVYNSRHGRIPAKTYGFNGRKEKPTVDQMCRPLRSPSHKRAGGARGGEGATPLLRRLI